VPKYPLLEFVLVVGTWETEVEAFPDTGFEGGLTIPRSMAGEILAEPDTGLFQMADRRVIEAPSWIGSIELGSHTFPVEVVALGDRFLLGRDVLDQLEICFRFGREVATRFEDE
jgi:hypothetical protein